MPTLETVLNRTRNGKYKCKDRQFLINFVNDNPNVDDLDVLQVKHLTKILSVVQKENKGVFDENLDHIYVYHLQGIGKVIDSDMHQDNKDIMEGHLRSHTSQFCVDLYRLDGNNFWLEEGKRMVKRAAELIGDIDLKYTAYRIKDAANISKLLYRDTRSLSEADEAYLLFSNYVQARKELPANVDGARRMKHKFAEEVFKHQFKDNLAKLKDKFQWGKRTFNSLLDIIQNGSCDKSSVTHGEMKLVMGRIKHAITNANAPMEEKVGAIQNLYTMEEEYLQVAEGQKYQAACNMRMAKLVQYQLQTTDDIKLTQLMANHFDKAGETYHQIGDAHMAFDCFKASSKVWKNLYAAFKDPKLLQRWYVSQSLLAESAKNPRVKATILYHKGMASGELLNVTKNSFYKGECQSSMEDFLQYANQHPDGLDINIATATKMLGALGIKYNDEAIGSQLA